MLVVWFWARVWLAVVAQLSVLVVQGSVVSVEHIFHAAAAHLFHQLLLIRPARRQRFSWLMKSLTDRLIYTAVGLAIASAFSRCVRPFSVAVEGMGIRGAVAAARQVGPRPERYILARRQSFFKPTHIAVDIADIIRTNSTAA